MNEVQKCVHGSTVYTVLMHGTRATKKELGPVDPPSLWLTKLLSRVTESAVARTGLAATKCIICWSSM